MIDLSEYRPLKKVISVTDCLSVTKTTIGITRPLLEYLGSPQYINFLMANDGKSMIITAAGEDGQKIRYSAYGSAVFNNVTVRKELLKGIEKSELPVRFAVECCDKVLVVDIEKWCNGISSTPIRSRK